MAIPGLRENLKAKASLRRWAVTLLAVFFALGALIQAGLIQAGPAQPAMSLSLAAMPDAEMAAKHAADLPSKHLPGQPHDARFGSCGLCGTVPIAIGSGQEKLLARGTDVAVSLIARGLPPPLPPPRLHA